MRALGLFCFVFVCVCVCMRAPSYVGFSETYASQFQSTYLKLINLVTPKLRSRSLYPHVNSFSR